jgi:outer membrane protein OmpA-like peptidoglycan-associated protein
MVRLRSPAVRYECRDAAAFFSRATSEHRNILKAYPNVHVRIGGYTDNQGDGAANLKLSQDRADDVMQQIVVLGVDPTRMDAKGYGEDHPVADNSTEAGRAQNRRISLRVTQK